VKAGGGTRNIKGRVYKGKAAMKGKGRKAGKRSKRSYPVTILDLQDDSW